MNLPSTLRNSRLLLHGPRFDVREVDVPEAGGGTVGKQVVIHPGAVVILPLLDDKTVVMIRNQRVAVGETLLELPAGTLEPGEAIESCAAREVVEETGYQAGRIEPLLDFYSSPGICTERMYCFVARELNHVGQDLDETEQITVEAVPLDEAVRKIRSGEIRDGKTIAALLYFAAFMGAAVQGMR
ncbi:MAG: NUDIX hydrolase [Planctomycetota bacterium]|nr:NUDIX hydrolase [Planctomycetota bacterium]